MPPARPPVPRPLPPPQSAQSSAFPHTQARPTALPARSPRYFWLPVAAVSRATNPRSQNSSPVPTSILLSRAPPLCLQAIAAPAPSLAQLAPALAFPALQKTREPPPAKSAPASPPHFLLPLSPRIARSQPDSSFAQNP